MLGHFCRHAIAIWTPYFSRRLKRKVGDDADSLFSSSWQLFLLTWSRAVRLSVASVEFLHASNRKRAQSSMKWFTLAALFTNEEFKRLSCASLALSNWPQGGSDPIPEEAVPEVPAARPPEAEEEAVPEEAVPEEAVPDAAVVVPNQIVPVDSAVANCSIRFKAKSALELYRDVVIARDRASGISVNPATASYWALVHQEWQDLDLDDKTYYQGEAERSRVTAKANRAMRKKMETSAAASATLPAIAYSADSDMQLVQADVKTRFVGNCTSAFSGCRRFSAAVGPSAQRSRAVGIVLYRPREGHGSR